MPKEHIIDSFGVQREVWNLDDYKEYCRKQIDEYYHITPSIVALRSFYVAEVEKPKEVTIKSFDWLRSITEQELKAYKSQLSQKLPT